MVWSPNYQTRSGLSLSLLTCYTLPRSGCGGAPYPCLRRPPEAQLRQNTGNTPSHAPHIRGLFFCLTALFPASSAKSCHPGYFQLKILIPQYVYTPIGISTVGATCAASAQRTLLRLRSDSPQCTRPTQTSSARHGVAAAFQGLALYDLRLVAKLLPL